MTPIRSVLNLPFALLRLVCAIFAWIIVFALHPADAPDWHEFWAFVWRGE